MANVVELPEDVFLLIQQAAEQEGVTPAEWIAETLRTSLRQPGYEGNLSAREALDSFIGVVDSSTETPDLRYRSQFGDLLDAEYERQGIPRPKWQR